MSRRLYQLSYGPETPAKRATKSLRIDRLDDLSNGDSFRKSETKTAVMRVIVEEMVDVQGDGLVSR